MSRQHKTEMDAYKEGSIQLVMQGLTDAWEHTRFVDVFNEGEARALCEVRSHISGFAMVSTMFQRSGSCFL